MRIATGDEADGTTSSRRPTLFSDFKFQTETLPQPILAGWIETLG
jgi:hypothetical protein